MATGPGRRYYEPARRMSAQAELREAGNGETMSLRKINWQRWEKLTAESDRQRAELLGWSPGGAAAQLGISRQAVHKAIHRGDLDAVMVLREDGKLSAFMIPDASLKAFAEKRSQRAAG